MGPTGTFQHEARIAVRAPHPPSQRLSPSCHKEP
jgi:hypothetical protein